jgi:NADH-quinone oxidoreductase subunit E
MSVRRLDPVQPDHFAFTPANLVWAKETIAKYPQGKQASAVIPILWRAQEQIGGWITRPALEYVAEMLDMSFVRIYEIATFYTMFQLSPVGRKAHVQLCGTTPCVLRGADGLKEVCRRRIHPDPHCLSADGDFSWEEVECLGACVNAPMVQIWRDTYEDLTPQTLERVLDVIAAGRRPTPGPQNGRQFSAPEGGPTTLTDLSLFDGEDATPGTASPEIAPGLRSPSVQKTSEAERSREETRERAETRATSEKALSRVARATKASTTSPVKLPPTRGINGAEPPPEDKSGE